MHPFDPKAAILAKHAQHVVLIHFPIALYMVAFVFDLLSRGVKRSVFATAAYLNLYIAAISTIPVVTTGLLAWQFALEGQRIKGVLLLHFALALASVVLIGLSWWIHRQSRRSPSDRLPGYRIPLEAITVIAIAATAHLGGFLSGVNV